MTVPATKHQFVAFARQKVCLQRSLPKAAAFSDRHFNMAACARVQPYLDSL